MLTVLKFLTKFILSFSVGGLIFVGLFKVIHSPPILIYRGFLLSILSFLILVAIEVLLSANKNISEAILGRAIGSWSLNIVILVLLPVTFERSVSVFLLREFEIAQPSGLTADELKERFEQGFVKDLAPVDRRIDEQTKSGNIELIDGKYILTKRGKEFLNFARVVLPYFSSDDKLLNHEVRVVGE